MPNLCVRCQQPTYRPENYPHQAIIDAPKDGTSILLPFDSASWPANTGVAHVDCLSPAEQAYCKMDDMLFEMSIDGQELPILESFYVPGALV